MYLVEDVRLASPMQLAGTQRHRKFFASPFSKEYVPPPLQAICAEVSSGSNKEEPMSNLEIAQATVAETNASCIPYDVTPFASHAANVIIHICSTQYRVSREEFMGPRRHARIIKARHAASYVARAITKWPLQEIGRRLGNKDHTTIRSGVIKVERMREQDPEFRTVIDRLVSTARERLKGCVSLTVPAVSQQHVPEQQGHGEGADFNAGSESLENRMRLDDQVTEDAAV